MTLSYRNQSILAAPESVIAHGCNLKGAMGAGVAKAIKDRWPAVFASYQYAIASGGMFLSAVNWAEVPNASKWVANVMTQVTYSKDPGLRLASYDAIDRGLRTTVTEALARGYVDQDQPFFAIPMIGCSNGHARWSVVREIINEIILDTGVHFVVYELDKKKYEQCLGGSKDSSQHVS